MSHFLHNIRLLLLASWLGAAVFFSSTVAPGAFSILRTFPVPNQSEIAGSFVSLTLSFIYSTGIIVSMLVLLTTFALKNTVTRRTFSLQVILLMIMAAATAVGGWVIAPRMSQLRAGFGGPIDQVAVADAGRLAFAALHGYSVTAVSVAMIAALIAFFVMSKRALPGRE